ncbi:hypothetical protein L195_g039318 [Trifolium pratense]|uniref:Uncharacterized protein n=1 Tax=Trifolium pratense TaxID=57577 RepID=A0A2K3LXL6_TRIPR|nr:hypothetical protein L195_g039318 [Trifolium pratense]
MASLLPNPNPMMLGLGGTVNAGEATNSIESMMSKCSVYGERGKGSAVEQETKAVRLLIIDSLEAATTGRRRSSNGALHEWHARKERKEA